MPDQQGSKNDASRNPACGAHAVVFSIRVRAISCRAILSRAGAADADTDIFRAGTAVIAAKRIFILAGLAFSLSAAAEPKPGAFDPRVRAELQALVDSWIDAEVRDDRRALEDILHEDFLSTFASGKTLDRAAYIDFIIALDISPFTVRNESIRQHGDTVVVIDVSESGTTKFTWIAVRRDGDWKVISQTFSTVTSAESN